MVDTQKENEEQVFLREPSKERTELYEMMREKYPKGNQKKQLEFSMEISDERISDYIDMFSITK